MKDETGAMREGEEAGRMPEGFLGGRQAGCLRYGEGRFLTGAVRIGLLPPVTSLTGLGVLVGFALRLNVAGLADALRMPGVHIHAYLPPQVFAACVQAELIRLGMTSAPQLPPPV